MREHVRHIHFVGIGGIGMSGIAEVLLNLGFRISGSDIARTKIIDRLEKAGATIFIGHDESNMKDADTVVYSSALEETNSEMQAALRQSVPLVPRAEMLGELMRFRKGIAVAGTHGKTTTTSLIGAVLAGAGIDPTLIVGGVVNSMHSNARLGRGEYMVAEADESDASFLHLQPQMAVMTNIDQDHMETYKGDFNQLKQACLDFLHNLPFCGLAILCFDDPAVREIAERLRKPFESYGLTDDVDYQAVRISQQGRHSSFSVLRYGKSIGEFVVAMPGVHNVQNALAAIAIAYRLGLETESIREALSGFEGIGRRFQQLGTVRFGSRFIEIVDDYAHHPTEIAATLKACQDCYPGRKILVVFQPHRFTRTLDLFDDFVCLLAKVENLVVTEVYPAGEQPIAGGDGRSLCRAIRQLGGEPVFAESLVTLNDILPGLVQTRDILLTLGAGDIGRFSHNLALKQQSDSREVANDG